MGGPAGVVVDVVVTLGVLGVVPLGLRLVAGRDVEVLRRLWWVAGAPAALAGWLPRSGAAVALAVPYVALTGALALLALRRAVRVVTAGGGLPWPVEVATWTALATPVVAAVALVAERAGTALLGFDLEILGLTVAHFHYAGFAAALVAALVARAAPDGPLRTAAALCVPGGTLLVLAGFFVGDAVELVGAVVLTAGLWAAGWLTWHDLRPGVADGRTRALLGVSSAVLGGTMLLALAYAVGEAFDLPHLSHAWMVATHGITNALGFAGCAVLAWLRLRAEPL